MWAYEIVILFSATMLRTEITVKQPLSLGSALAHFQLGTVVSTCFPAGNNSSEQSDGYNVSTVGLQKAMVTMYPQSVCKK